MSLSDGLAFVFFLMGWAGYDWLVSRSRWSRHSLSAIMNAERAAWITQTRARRMRMVDAQVIGGLQQGAAFFASTALLAIGAGLAALNAGPQFQAVTHDLGLAAFNGPRQVELKLLALTALFAYAFFKFGWSYRLFNYASILLGAIPEREDDPTPEQDPEVQRTVRLLQVAGSEFNRGLRALFLAVATLGWFAGPAAFVASTGVMLLLLSHRQFFSAAQRAVRPTAR